MDNQKLLEIIFIVLVPVLLFIDLFLNSKPKAVGPKDAITQSLLWVLISVIFGGLVWHLAGEEKGAEYFTAYGIEKMLSVDNLFVFSLIFTFFNVDEKVRHKVLFYGIIGAIVLRAIFIFIGSGIINATYMSDFNFVGLHFEKPNVILILFGIFLIYAGIKSFGGGDEDENLDENKAVIFSKWLFSKFNYTGAYDGNKFLTYNNGIRYFTLLAFVVLVVELTDLLFAVDSIPAIFTVSKDPFILYSSNIFAILGLRALYFLLDAAKKWFEYLPYGVAGILIFIGVKMVIAPILHIESLISLYVVLGLLVISILASMFHGQVIEDKKDS
ncbi:MAG: TerC/Alx family metal homeostasis membrane protein [Saprospiraceae bacterium]|nr:TerC/Alx family metal homeostasis membrane protein [Saprospiraceae bacterium]MBP6567190.1 TerC/Alx family metal homeostasis membrane protein [Saprospiraceae bacterium]